MSLQGVAQQVVEVAGITPSPFNTCNLCFEDDPKCQCHLPREVCEAIYAPIDYEEEATTTCQGDNGILVRPVVFNDFQKDIYHRALLNRHGTVLTLMVADCRDKKNRYTMCENSNELSVAISNAVGYWVPTSLSRSPGNYTRPYIRKPVYCEICRKELCNKYFMKTHMMKRHGINIETTMPSGDTPRK